MQNSLFEYIDKIRMVVEYLARGEEIITNDKTVISFNRDVTSEMGKISLEEIELWDTLEGCLYGELGSLKRIIELVNEYEWEELKEKIDPIISQEIDLDTMSEEDRRIYKTIKTRIRQILNKMVLQLYLGMRVITTYDDLMFIKALELQKEMEATMEDALETEEYEDELEENEKGQGNFENKSGNQDFDNHLAGVDGSSQSAEAPYMIYSATQGEFYLMKEGEVLIKNINVALAMEITAAYLYENEKQKASKELQSRKTERSNIKYDGLHIFVDRDKEIDEK